MKGAYLIVGLSWYLALLLGGSVRGAAVAEAEAIGVAEWWYAAEVNATTTSLPPAEKEARVAARHNHTVAYVLGRDSLQPARRATDAVSAYVVAFKPSGFAVVSGEDTLQPVLVFNATGSANLSGSPKTNYLAYYLGRCVVQAVQRERSLAVPHPTHTNWTRVRQWMSTGVNPLSIGNATPGAAPARPKGGGGPAPSPKGGRGPSGPDPKDGGIYVMLPTALWAQGDYYNNECVAENGGIDVPTGCVATALAIQFRYYQWPWSGNSSHTYTDSLTNAAGAWLTFTQSVNFAAQYYNWNNMPTNDLTANNADVANLMYDCGVAVDMGYSLHGSGAWAYGQDPSPAINDYFCYRGTYVINSTNTSDHTPGMSYCIQCGVPVVVGTSDHCFVACGYRTTVTPYFYFNMGWSGTNDGWYDVTDVKPDADNPLNGSLPYSTPNDYAYTDGTVPASGNGDLQTPYQTLAQGVAGVSSGGVLWLKAGQYHGNLTLNKPMMINSYLGAATIGGP